MAAASDSDRAGQCKYKSFMRIPIPKSAVPTIIVSATLSVFAPSAAASSPSLRHTCPSFRPDLALKVTPIIEF